MNDSSVDIDVLVLTKKELAQCIVAAFFVVAAIIAHFSIIATSILQTDKNVSLLGVYVVVFVATFAANVNVLFAFAYRAADPLNEIAKNYRFSILISGVMIVTNLGFSLAAPIHAFGSLSFLLLAVSFINFLAVFWGTPDLIDFCIKKYRLE